MYRTTTESSGQTPTTRDTLYEACRAIHQIPGGLVLRGTTLVAFHCGWTGNVIATCNATETERSAIADYRL